MLLAVKHFPNSALGEIWNVVTLQKLIKKKYCRIASNTCPSKTHTVFNAMPPSRLLLIYAKLRLQSLLVAVAVRVRRVVIAAARQGHLLSPDCGHRQGCQTLGTWSTATDWKCQEVRSVWVLLTFSCDFDSTVMDFELRCRFCFDLLPPRFPGQWPEFRVTDIHIGRCCEGWASIRINNHKSR